MSNDQTILDLAENVPAPELVRRLEAILTLHKGPNLCAVCEYMDQALDWPCSTARLALGLAVDPEDPNFEQIEHPLLDSTRTISSPPTNLTGDNT